MTRSVRKMGEKINQRHEQQRITRETSNRRDKYTKISVMERKQSPTHLSYQAICSLSKSLLAKFVFLVTQNLPRFQLPFFYTNNIPFSSFSSFFQSPSIRLYKVTFQLVFKRDGSHIFLLGNQHLKSNQTQRAGHIWSGYDRTSRRHINSWTRDKGQRALLSCRWSLSLGWQTASQRLSLDRRRHCNVSRQTTRRNRKRRWQERRRNKRHQSRTHMIRHSG